ncbi:PAS fold protein [Hydrogenophaga sp. T4]|nr:PAS fold protein [Hydrogenophaga sp. T4]
MLDGAPSTPYVSPRIRDLGYTPEQWLEQPDAWLRALHPDDRERVLDEQAEGLEAGEPLRCVTGCAMRPAGGGTSRTWSASSCDQRPGHDRQRRDV